MPEARMLREDRRALGGRLVAVSVAVLSLHGCRRTPCDVGDVRCRGNVAESCGERSGGEIAWYRDGCISAAHCKVVDGFAFCALETTPHPLCGPGVGYACDDGEQVLCTSGFITTRSRCVTCDLGGAECAGGLDTPCNPESECVQGAFCHPDRSECAASCDCPAGEPCASCEMLFSDALGPTQCIDGECAWARRVVPTGGNLPHLDGATWSTR